MLTHVFYNHRGRWHHGGAHVSMAATTHRDTTRQHKIPHVKLNLLFNIQASYPGPSTPLAGPCWHCCQQARRCTRSYVCPTSSWWWCKHLWLSSQFWSSVAGSWCHQCTRRSLVQYVLSRRCSSPAAYDWWPDTPGWPHWQLLWWRPLGGHALLFLASLHLKEKHSLTEWLIYDHGDDDDVHLTCDWVTYLPCGQSDLEQLESYRFLRQNSALWWLPATQCNCESSCWFCYTGHCWTVCLKKSHFRSHFFHQFARRF